jgi:hypothetical protein
VPSRQRLPLWHKDKESVNDGNHDTQPPPPPPPPPFNMPDMAKFWANATQFMTTMMAAMPQQGDRNDMVGCSSANQKVLENSKTLSMNLSDALRYTDSQKVNFTRLKLDGEVNYRWKANNILIDEEIGQGIPISWYRFKREFND